MTAWAKSDPRVNSEQLLQASDVIARRKRGEGKIRSDIMLDDRDRVERVVQSGLGAAELRADINSHWAEGVYGLGKWGMETRASLLKRMESGKRDANWLSTSGPRQGFRQETGADEAFNDYAKKKTFLYEQALREALDAHPDWTPAQAYVQAEVLRKVYRDMGGPKVEASFLEQLDRATTEQPKTEAEKNALAPGTPYIDPKGQRRIRQ